ncbi:MAG: tail fiber domain-containing protein [Limisphaerales bacterium]
MDFIKGNEQVRIDPSGIDISGVGNIIIDSNSITGDISFNNKVNFIGDVSMNGKVSISDNLDVTGDVSMSGIIDLNSDVSMNGVLDICGNIKFGDTHVNRTWFGGGFGSDNYILGRGWHLVKYKPEGSVMTNNTGYDFTDNIGTFEDNINSNVEFARNINDIVGLSNPDQILIYITGSLGLHWYVIDYIELKNHENWPDSGQGSGTKISDTALLFSNEEKTIIHQLAPFSTYGIHLYISNNTGQPDWDNDEILRSAPSVTVSNRRSHTNISIFARNSTNLHTPTHTYPTLIKKESDHLHITAPLNIYPEGNYELDDLGVSKAKDLKFDGNNGTDDSETVDNSGGWYLVRQANAFVNGDTQPYIYNDNFHFGITYGTKQNGDTYTSGHLWARNVSNYDYDEVLFYMEDAGDILWQIWDRTPLESLMSRYDGINLQVTGVKKSSVSSNPHTVEAHVRPNSHNHHDPQIMYSYPGSTGFGGGGRWWEAYESRASHRSYYVRRSDGQPVRLKNKVKVDVEGNLDVDGIITCSRLAASTTDTGITSLTVTSEGFVGIGTTTPQAPLEIFGASNSITKNTSVFVQTGNGDAGNGYIYASDSRTKNYTLICNGDMLSKEYMSYSDSRIKTDTLVISDDVALKQVNALESKEYHYIDPDRRRQMKTIGFIAQEVKDVIPNAINFITDYIPDEMRIISETQWEGSTLTIPDLDMSGNFTGKAKFYVANDPSGNDEVCKELEIKEVPDNSRPLFPTATKFVAEFDKPWTNVFFYGKEVSDFHTIDKAQIFALHHSAIQELSRKNDEKSKKISVLENKVNSMTVTTALLKSTNESLKSRLEALESIVLTLQNK